MKELLSFYLELDRIYHESKIEEWYVKLDGSIQFEDGSLQTICADDYVDDWLINRSGHHLAILGDYGTGKSWFCLRLAKRLADSYQKAPQTSMLPLLISFRRYQRRMDLLELIKAELFDGYGVELLNPAALKRLLQTGQILPILDGMDEMAKELGERTALVAYSRLGLAFEIPRAIVTCRTHYFYSGSEEREILSPNARSAMIEKAAKFEIVHLKLLDGRKIKKCIQQRFGASRTEGILHFVESTYNLPELCSRPLLLSMVCDSQELLGMLPNPSSSVELYEAYVSAWLRRELKEGRLTIDPEVVREFFEDLAELMVNRNTMVLGSSRLQKMFSKLLDRLGLSRQNWKDVERQLITSTFLRRTSSDSWEFAHRSFQEFFYARKFFRWEHETNGQGRFSVIHIPIWQFVAEMALAKWNEEKALYWIAPRIDRREDPTLTLTTLRAAAAYWLLKRGTAEAHQYTLAGIMLDCVLLQDLNLSQCGLAGGDFSRSDIARTKLVSADLSSCCLVAVNFDEGVLDSVRASSADCRWASFVGASLRDADFREANLEGAMLVGADLQGIKLSGAKISLADFRSANFGELGSDSWLEGVTQLRECSGFESAIFDEAVLSSVE